MIPRFRNCDDDDYTWSFFFSCNRLIHNDEFFFFSRTPSTQAVTVGPLLEARSAPERNTLTAKRIPHNFQVVCCRKRGCGSKVVAANTFFFSFTFQLNSWEALFQLSGVLDKPRSQVSALVPPGARTFFSFLSRAGSSTSPLLVDIHRILLSLFDSNFK